MAARPPTGAVQGPLIHNLVFRGILYQVLAAGAVIFLGWYFFSNTTENLARQGIATGLDFLWEDSGFDIGETWIDVSGVDSYGWLLISGLLNTLYVSAIGVVLATVVGVTVGIARVSSNWLIAKLAAIYVESFRNVPILLQIIFWATVIRNLPHPRQALNPFEGVFISNRGIVFAIPVDDPIHPWIGVAFVVGIVTSILLVRYSNRRRDLTGQIIPVFWPSLGLVFGLPLLVWLVAGAPLVWNVPELKSFNFRGGARSTPEFAALLAGLVAYTAAFIAEIVRSGIQSVGIGQIEAARSVGLRPGQIMRLITIPQALRVIVPPVTSMYLSLTKNSSLAVAIGYPDLVNVGNTTVNQTGQAVEAIALMMLVYLIISLTISTFMNYYNRYVAIVER